MSVTIDEILLLAGRLDDTPGFDAPRERFRRFLLSHVRDAATARALIEQCQHTPGEQHQRALQDLVVLLGRFLGFDPTFGSYVPLGGGVKYDGQWLSRSRFQVVVEIRSDQTAGVGLESLSRSVAALATTSAPSARAAGLCVLASSYVSRRKADETAATASATFPVGVVALRSLLSLADLVGAGSVTHDDVVRMLEFSIPADFVVGLLERRQPGGSAVEKIPEGNPIPKPSAEEPRYWIATVGPDHATKPEQILELVVGKRHVFGLSGTRGGEATAARGDWICFYIPGKGAVGHARVASLADDGGSIRDAHRFRHLIHLDDVEVHLARPVPLDLETELQLRSAAPTVSRLAHTLVRISRETYFALTATRESPGPETATVEVIEPAPSPAAPESIAAAVRAPATAPSKRRR